MAVKVRSTSRLNFSRLLTIDEVEHWEMAELPVIVAAQDDTFYQVNQEDRIDLIAQRFYGNPELWWVIAVANGLDLLPNDLKPFSTIRIPSNSRVFNKILREAPKRKEGR
jgi:nucleoid-associated protein YgaU